MAITQGLCNSYKLEILQGAVGGAVGHTTANTYKCALYTSMATLNPQVTAYTTIAEVVGTQYTAGGVALTACQAVLDTVASVAYLDFADATWGATATIKASGAMIFDTTTANRSVCVLAFGSSYACANGSFVVQFPAAAAGTALIRIT